MWRDLRGTRPFRRDSGRVVALVAGALLAPVAGAVSARAAPDAPPPPATALCMAAVDMVVPIAGSHDYAISLESLRGADGIASGRLAIYTDSAKYDIPFTDIVAATPNHRSNA